MNFENFVLIKKDNDRKRISIFIMILLQQNTNNLKFHGIWCFELFESAVPCYFGVEKDGEGFLGAFDLGLRLRFDFQLQPRQDERGQRQRCFDSVK